MARVYRVAIIGLGAIGRRMLRNMPRQGRLEVAGGWDIDAEARAAAADEFSWLHVSEDAEALIEARDIDLVYIGVPPAAHGLYARAAIAAGKAVFCEKPLGVDLTESRDLVALAEAGGTRHSVNLSLAAARGVGAMREALAKTELGDVMGVDIRLHFARWPRDWQASATWLAGRAEGGFTREVATHFLYLAEALLGRGRLISASTIHASDTAVETHALARLECGNVPVTLAGTVGGAGPDLVEFTLWGSRQSLRLADFYRLWRSTGGAWENALPEIENLALDTYMLQLDELVRFLDGKSHLLPDFSAALRTQELVEAILAAGGD